MTKRILCFLIVLAMLVSVLPISLVSAEVSDGTLTKHTHTDAHACSEQCGGSVTWTAWNSGDSLPTESGHYYLTGDVQLTASNDVAAGKDITICLNGYNIRAKASTKVSFVYGKLTISDCTAYELEGTYISGTVVGSTSGDGAVFGVRRGGTFVLESGRITGGKTTGTGGGGVIYTQGGTSAGAGGMVYMYGGEMVGVEGYNGGAVCLGGGSAAYTPSAFYMYGGKITGNNARNHGGGIYVVDWSILEIHGGEVTGNTVKNKGAAVYMAGANSKLTVSGAAKLDGVFFNNASNKGLMVDELTEGAMIDVTTTATDFAKVISIAQGGKQDSWSAHWVTANGESVSMVEGIFKAGHYHGNVKYEAWTGSDSHNTLPTGGKNYYLANDIIRNTNGGTVSIGAGVTQRMCLNGHTITHRNPANRLYNIQGNFTLEDCTAKTENGQYISGGITYGGTTASTRTYGNCFSVQVGGTMTLEDGQIYGFYSDCKEYEDSVPVYIQGGSAKGKATFIMNGGQIHSNSSKSLGAAIKSTRNANPNYDDPTIVQLNGGKIWGNTSLSGGAVAATGDKLIITGGEITGNTCVSGAVYLTDQVLTTISGNPQIKDNQGGNLYLSGDRTLTLGQLEKTARIYLSVEQCDRAIAEGVEESILENIYCDSTYRMLVVKDGKLFVEVSDEHPHCLCYGRTEGCDHKSVKWQAWESTVSLPTTDGYYYLLGDVNLAARATVAAGADVHICLNGKTVTAPQNNRIVLIQAGGKLAITDCNGGGKLTGGSNTYGGAINVNKGASFSLYGGEISGNQGPMDGTGLGGAIYGQPGATVNIYGGEISNNTAYAGGGIYMAEAASEAEGGKLTVYGGIISDNHSGYETVDAEGKTVTKGGNGAAIYVNKFGQLTMLGGTVTRNAGLGYGGNIYLNGAIAKLTGGKITKNEGKKDGAGFYAVAGSTVEVGGDLVISDNISANGAGGGFGASGKSQIKMTGGTVSGNYAVQGGGAIIQSGATMILEGGTFRNNESKAYAGAIYVNAPNADGTLSTLYIKGGTITENVSGNAAGGVYCREGYVEMTGGTISKNETQNFGCGIYYFKATGKVIGGTITQNVSGKDGTGIYVYAGAVEIGGDVKITNNTSLKGAGGGLGFTKESKSKLTGGTITGNSAGNAGGIIVQGKAHLTMTGGYVANNTTKGAGGGVYVNKSSMDFYGGTIGYNKSTKSGAGLFANESAIRFGGTAFIGNEATANGGGAYINKGTATFSGGSFKNNSTQRYGGALYFNNAEITMQKVTVTGNSAAKDSAGFHGYSGKITVRDCVFAENTATGAGAGFTVTRGCELLAENTVVEKNTANNGSLLIQNWAKATLNDMILRENETTAGSGLYVYSDVEVTMNGGQIVDNISISKLDKNGNTVGGDGAGVYMHTATATRTGRSVLQLNNVEIRGNLAARDGGGVYVNKQMVCHLNGCTVQNNTAAGMGAGIFQNTGTMLTVKNTKILANQGGDQGSAIYAGSDFTLESSVITGNKTTNGAAVYIGPARYDGHSYVNATLKFGGDVQICDNEGTMDDLYIDEGAAIGVTKDGFGQNTKINVQLHSGVLTNTILGKYDYEGGDLHYVLTYGEKSLTDPEKVVLAQTEDTQETPVQTGDVLLYVGIGIVALAAIAGAVLLLKKKKSPAGEGK